MDVCRIARRVANIPARARNRGEVLRHSATNAMRQLNAQSALVEMNTRWLRQALDLLGRLDQHRFSTSPQGMVPHRASSHLRHIIEFYECFLDGLEPTHIDYDARRRDVTLESSIAVAADRICRIIARLEAETLLRYDGVLFVRMEDAAGFDLADPFLMSSVARELMTLSSHTIHHFALIAMTVRAHGVVVDPDFGVAPSTLRYREQKQTARAAEAA